MTLRTAISAEQVIADKINTATYQQPSDQKKPRTATIDVRELRQNHRMFEWDVNAGTIKPAEVVESTVLIGAKKSYKQYIEYLIKPGCFYQPALNAENAERKFKSKVKMANGKTIREMEVLR